MVFICMAVLLLTGSNFTNMVLLLFLIFLLAFKSTKDQKSIIVICLMFLVVFMAKVSPQNNKYVFDSIINLFHPPKSEQATIAVTQSTGNIAGPEEVKRKIAQKYIDSINWVLSKKETAKPAPRVMHTLPNYHGRILITGPDINKPPYLTPTDTTDQQRRLLTFIDAHKNSLPISRQTIFKPGLPGKVTELLQTALFFQHHPLKVIVGDGIGNFSSKLAFKATGLGFEGGYPAKYIYISRDFLSNHLDIYLNFFSRKSGLHSLTNSPFSVYDQLIAEYGLLGIAAFSIFYLWFFAKHFKKLTYGVPVLIMMMAFFFIDYWFEQLSVIVFFELLLLLNIKETSALKPMNYEYK